MARCAGCGSSQKPAAADCSVSSVICRSLPARSKTLPRDLDTVTQIFKNGHDLFKHSFPQTVPGTHRATEFRAPSITNRVRDWNGEPTRGAICYTIGWLQGACFDKRR